MINERGKKSAPVPSVNHKSHMYFPGIKPGAEEPATTHLSYGMAMHLMIHSEVELNISEYVFVRQ
jgi:hypothetical protein